MEPVKGATLDSTLDATLRGKLERCAALPTLPAVALKVLELCQRESLDLAEVAKTISNDPALAAKVLRTVNSSVYGLRQEVRTVAHATSLLGANAIRTLALSFSLVQGLKKNDKTVLAGYWKRSIVCAVAARELATLCKGALPDEAFLAGLLQDIGMLALSRLMGAEYPRLFAEAKGDHARFAASERRVFGCDHAVVGAWLAARWRLPAPTVVAIGASHDPSVLSPASVDRDVLRLAQVAGLAGCLADVWAGGSAMDCVERLRCEAGKWFPEALPHLEVAMARTAVGMRVVAELFEEEVGTPEEITGILDQARDALVMASLRVTQEVVVAQSERDLLVARTRELEEKSATDGLTGLLNRAAFDTYLEDQMASCRRLGMPLSLIMIDVDHFKQINDRHGHVAGDGVLQRLAHCLRGTHRAKDKPCRYGGEEFAVILPETDSVGARVVAERLREKIAQTPHVLPNARSIAVTASFGVVTCGGAGSGPTSGAGAAPQDFNSPSELITAADGALYQAKHAGRNRVAVWSAEPAAARDTPRDPRPRATV